MFRFHSSPLHFSAKCPFFCCFLICTLLLSSCSFSNPFGKSGTGSTLATGSGTHSMGAKTDQEIEQAADSIIAGLDEPDASGSLDGIDPSSIDLSDSGTNMTDSSLANAPAIAIGTGAASQILAQSGSGQDISPEERAKRDRYAAGQKTHQAERRKDFRSIIQKGDYFRIKNDEKEALRYYLIASMKLGDDNVVESKIAGLYFGMKKYNLAYQYYHKIDPTLISPEDKNRLLLCLMYLKSPAIATELARLDVQKETHEYFADMYQCLGGINACISGISGYTGTSQPLQDIRNVIDHYQDISNDLQYRNIRIAGIAFAQGQYSVSAALGAEVIQTRPDYQSALKLTGYSYYEMGDYPDAKEFFQKLYAFTPTDTDLTYALGMVYYHLGDYSTSSLYYNAAITNGYTPKSEIERRLVYNNFIIGDTKNALKVLRYLLLEPDVTVDDYSIAIWLAINEDDTAHAALWLKKGRDKYPKNDTMLAFSAWVYRLQKNVVSATSVARNALKINPRNAIALLQMGILAFDAGDYSISQSYLENVKSIDRDGAFAIQADEYLSRIPATTLAASGTTAS